jgi:hypothetical protein
MKDFDIFKIFIDMLENVASIFPNILGSIFVFFVGWVIARFVSKLLKRVFKKVGVDRLSDYINELELFGENSFRVSLSKILTGFIYYFILLMTWVAAADVLGIEAISDLLNDVIAYVPNLLVAFVYILLGIFLADLARKFVMTTLQSLGIPSASLISGFIFYFLIINILLGALTQAKISTEFIASNISIILGGVVLAFAIGYGLASKEMAGNIISTFYWKDKFQPGDEIEVDGVEGVIISIEKSHLVVQTEKGEAIIPMNKIVKDTIIVRHKNIVEEEEEEDSI